MLGWISSLTYGTLTASLLVPHRETCFYEPKVASDDVLLRKWPSIQEMHMLNRGQEVLKAFYRNEVVASVVAGCPSCRTKPPIPDREIPTGR